MIRHHVVGRVDTHTVLSSYATGDGRLACTAPTTDPVDVLEFAIVAFQTSRSLSTRNRICSRRDGRSAGRPRRDEICPPPLPTMHRSRRRSGYSLPLLNLRR